MKNFNKIIEEIKEIRKAEHLSDEAKARIKKALIEEESKKFNDKRIIKFNSFSQKVAAVFICCFVLSSCAFAGDIGNMISKVFSNQDKNIEFAIENGYVQNIEMDYVKSNGVNLKADYFYLDNYYMYIAFDVKADREFNEVLLNKFEIIDENNNIVYSDSEMHDDIFFRAETKKQVNTSGMLLLRLSKLQGEFLDYKELKINIQKIEFKKDEEFKKVSGNWNIEFIVEDNNIKTDKDEYYLLNQELIENYKVELKGNMLKMDLKFNEDNMKNFSPAKGNIYLEDGENNIYDIGENMIYSENKLIVHFPIDSYNKKDNLKLKINCDNKILVFYLKKADS